jgi:hypothetical protein
LHPIAASSVAAVYGRRKHGTHSAKLDYRLKQDEHIAFVRKSKSFASKMVKLPKRAPRRPARYFHDCYDEDAIKESNKLAVRSVRKIVK